MKRFFGRWSIKSILTMFLFILSVFVLVISGIVQIASYNQTQQEAIGSKQNTIANDVTGQVVNFIQIKLVVMDATVMSASLTEGQKKLTQILEGLLGLQTAFRNVALLDKSGKLLAGSSRASQATFDEFMSQVPSSLMNQIQSNNHYFSPIYFDKKTKEPMILIAAAEKSVLGNIKNVLVCEITLKFMWDLLANLQVGKTGYAYVVDRFGILIAFKDPTRVLQSENVSPIKTVANFMLDAADAGNNSVLTYKGITGTEVVGKYVALKVPDWAVIVELPVTEAFKEVEDNLIRTAIITLIMAVIAGFLGRLLANQIASPLIKLTATASRIAEGDMLLQAKVEGSKETSTLAQAFNSMTTQLRNKVDGFRHANELLTEIITKAKEMIVNLNSAAREIEAASQEQTSASNEHASGIREVSATLEELTITAKQITGNVGELVLSSEEALKLLKESENQLASTAIQIEEVGAISKDNAHQINELGKRSIIINEMVELIKQVANKTNILSINASIEASRAGRTNSGFSVVAAEIRLLSKETIESAKKAEAAAKDIQNFLNTIITSSENESAKVISSGKTAKDVWDNVEKIVARINNNYTFTQKINVSLKQQEHGSVQAAETIRQMAEIARQSADTAKEMLKAAKDIVALGQGIDETVMKFVPEKQA